MTSTSRKPSHAARRRRSPLLPALLVVAAGAAAAWWGLSREEVAVYDGPVRAVTRGPLTIGVSEAGTIEAREKVVLKCEVDERSTTITYIVEEGTLVEEGDLLVELDASVLTDELYDEEIDVLDTEAEFIAARENLEVVKNQAIADVSAAELALRFAREDIKKYVEGEYPKQLMEATNNVKLAEEQLQQAHDTLAWSERLSERGFLAGSELDRDRLAKQSAELDVELARAEVALLEEYTHGRQLAQLESDVQQAELALDRVTRKSKADIAQAESTLAASEKQLERQRAQLADIQQQVEKCVIRAPVAGMVVYATTGQGSWRGNDEPLQVGREVYEQEELIHIPVADSKSARVKVHESALDKVRNGQPVTVSVDALPSRVFEGVVARISPLPDAQTQWLNPDLKVFDTEIHLLGDLTGLRTGMTCRAEILVEHYEDTLFVPVHCVVRVGDAPTVYVVEEGRLVRRPVEVGLDNNRMVRVVSGLEEGELVALAPPLDEAETTDARPGAGAPGDAGGADASGGAVDGAGADVRVDGADTSGGEATSAGEAGDERTPVGAADDDAHEPAREAP